MPLHSVDTATYQVRSAHTHSPSVVLLTDETTLERLPPPLRAATNQIWLGARLAFEPPTGVCGWLRWGQGERLLQGTSAQLRFAFTVPGRRFFLPIHYQCGDWELLGLEPRCFTSGPDRADGIDLRLRIAAAPPGEGDDGAGDAGAGGEPWQRLAAALRLETVHLGTGIAPLARLAQTPGLHPTLHALCLRNLVVALLRQNEREQAEKLLGQAREVYPTYRELDYLAARLLLSLGRGAEAVTCLQRATMPAPAAGGANEPLFVGSGGESGYRAHYLLALLAEHTGRQQVALHHFLSGLRQLPAYPPSVAGLMRQRLSVEAFASLQWELTRLGRREPHYQPLVFDFFLLHRAFEAAENLLRVWRLTPEAHARLAGRLQALAPLYRPTQRAPDMPAGIVLSGPILMHSSVARINRYLAAALRTDPGLDLALEPTSPGEEPAAAFPRAAIWAPSLTHLPRRLDLTIRHGWPPDFQPAVTGRLALILPWEFGAIPKAWLAGLSQVDEVWVPSAFVRGVLLRAGVEPDRVTVIPNGVDLELYAPQGDRYRPEGARRTEFLFAGGAIRRKGLDLLLRAWRDAFTAADDVSLVIKDLGARSFYQHLNLRAEIESAVRDPGAAPIFYIGEEWSEARLPSLYRGADVVVLPYRGEGFGMPLAEAMACAKPIIATAAGPAPEFCPPDAGWLIPALESPVPRPLCPPGEMTGPLTWFEPSLPGLVTALRAAAQDRAECGRRGEFGAEAIRRNHSWQAVTTLYHKRIVRLLARQGAGLSAPPAPAVERSLPIADAEAVRDRASRAPSRAHADPRHGVAARSHKGRRRS